MNVATRNNKGTTVVDVVGHIDLGTSPVLRKALLDALKGTQRLAANLVDVKYIDSSGIASLLEVLKEARSAKKHFVLFGLTPAVRGGLAAYASHRNFRNPTNRGRGGECLNPDLEPRKLKSAPNLAAAPGNVGLKTLEGLAYLGSLAQSGGPVRLCHLRRPFQGPAAPAAARLASGHGGRCGSHPDRFSDFLPVRFDHGAAVRA